MAIQVTEGGRGRGRRPPSEFVGKIFPGDD